ncbi:MAG: hypothetical protein IPJ20_19645 [Flammeovirgaceae bacterium]|nr:hypothetical protein [Flammeovirgaceae bacterium]
MLQRLIRYLYFRLLKAEREESRQAARVRRRLEAIGGDFRETRVMQRLYRLDNPLFLELLLSAFESCGYRVSRDKTQAQGNLEGIVVNPYGKKNISIC